MKHIFAKNQSKNGNILGASQDGSQEFISLLAGICTDSTALPPALIYENKSGDLQDTWLKDFDHPTELAYFGASSKGWTKGDLGVYWLEKIFEPKTAAKADKSYRLLIVDGHSSHVNMQFINICNKYRIILAILPPHSTHRLQPLDLKIFLPLSNAYSREIDRVFQESGGYTRTIKRSFWAVFKVAWFRVLTKANIFSAFEAAGINPYNPSVVLDKIQDKPFTPPPSVRRRCSAEDSRGPTWRATLYQGYETGYSRYRR